MYSSRTATSKITALYAQRRGYAVKTVKVPTMGKL